jgi:hypothetical protein
MRYRNSQLGQLSGRKVLKMRTLGKVSILMLSLVASAVAQSRLKTGVPGGGSGPAYSVGFGYAYLTTSIPGAGRVNLNGLDASGNVDLTPHWGATIDSSYVRTSNILSTGNSGYVLSLLAGPVFYPFEHGNTRTFVHALGGAGLVDSAVPQSGTTYLHGWVARYAYAVGGGIEQSVANRLSIRVSGDYLRTAFVNSSDVVQLQDNLRLTAGIVVHLNHKSW